MVCSSEVHIHLTKATFVPFTQTSPIHSAHRHPASPTTPFSERVHTMEIWFECTTSGQRCAAEVGEGCSAADLQERAVAVLYPQSVVSAEAVGLCVDDAEGEVLAPEVLIADTALCAGGTVYVSRRKDSSGVWVPHEYPTRGISTTGDVCEGTLVTGAVTINLVTTEVTPTILLLCRVVLMPHHIVYCGSPNKAVHFRPRDSGAEVVVQMASSVLSLVAMRVTEAVLIGTTKQVLQYSCEGVKMRTLDLCGHSFAVSPCETLFLSNTYPTLVVHRLDTPKPRVVHRVKTGLGLSFYLKPSFSPDASLAVVSCGSKHIVRTIDIVSGKALCTLPNGEYYTTGACFSACSRYLFTSCTGSVQQWDARSGVPMGRTNVSRASSLFASSDGRRLVAVSSRICVLDIAAINMQVSEEDALQHGLPRPRPLPLKRTVVATESCCSGCVCS